MISMFQSLLELGLPNQNLPPVGRRQFNLWGPNQLVARQNYSQRFNPLPPDFWQTEDPGKLECGDKIVLPQSALYELSRMKIQFPIMFEITNANSDRKKVSHCSVLEFTAPEGTVYMPVWMFRNLGMDPGETSNVISLRNVPLKKGTFVSLQPHTSDFTELSNPRALLEMALRNFSCLTKGDTIQISPKELGRTYLLNVVELRPANQVSIIETDVRVEFIPPLDSTLGKVPQRKVQVEENKEEVKLDSDDDLMGGLFGDEESTKNPKKLEKRQYFRKLSGGCKLNGKPILAHQSAPMLFDIDSKKNRVEEIVGQMRYIYEVDSVTGEKTVIRRLPLRRNLTGLGPGNKLGQRTNDNPIRDSESKCDF